MMSKGNQCRVYAVVSLDSRGQIVLPKDLRDKAHLKPDDRLAVIGCESGDELCCMVMMKTDRLSDSIKTMLGPMLKDIME